jgi:hypothetical protein
MKLVRSVVAPYVTSTRASPVGDVEDVLRVMLPPERSTLMASFVCETSIVVSGSALTSLSLPSGKTRKTEIDADVGTPALNALSPTTAKRIGAPETLRAFGTAIDVVADVRMVARG